MEKNKTPGKYLKYLVIAGLVLILGYRSMYFQKLDEHKRSSVPATFNAAAYTSQLWNGSLNEAIAKAVDLSLLDSLLRSDPTNAFANYSNALSIGNYRYFLVKATGQVDAVNEDDVTLVLPAGHTPQKAVIATEFIYGNALRDASRLVAVTDFANSKDLNDISAELNGMVRKHVVPAFKSRVKKNDRVEVIGAIEVNKEHIRLEGIEITPVQLKIIQ